VKSVEIHFTHADRVLKLTLDGDDLFITCGRPGLGDDAFNFRTIHVPADGPLRDLANDVLAPLKDDEVQQVRIPTRPGKREIAIDASAN
jgi:hypothetical protein